MCGPSPCCPAWLRWNRPSTRSGGQGAVRRVGRRFEVQGRQSQFFATVVPSRHGPSLERRVPASADREARMIRLAPCRPRFRQIFFHQFSFRPLPLDDPSMHPVAETFHPGCPRRGGLQKACGIKGPRQKTHHGGGLMPIAVEGRNCGVPADHGLFCAARGRRTRSVAGPVLGWVSFFEIETWLAGWRGRRRAARALGCCVSLAPSTQNCTKVKRKTVQKWCRNGAVFPAGLGSRCRYADGALAGFRVETHPSKLDRGKNGSKR